MSDLKIVTSEFECVAGVPALLALGVEGAVGAVTWELTDVPHAVPTGMQLTTQGVVGAPNQIGMFRFRVSATDRLEPFPQSTTCDVTVTVVAPDPAETVDAVAPPFPGTVETMDGVPGEGIQMNADGTPPVRTVADVTDTQPTTDGYPVADVAAESVEVAPGAQIVTPGAAAPVQGL